MYELKGEDINSHQSPPSPEAQVLLFPPLFASEPERASEMEVPILSHFTVVPEPTHAEAVSPHSSLGSEWFSQNGREKEGGAGGAFWKTLWR